MARARRLPLLRAAAAALVVVALASGAICEGDGLEEGGVAYAQGAQEAGDARVLPPALAATVRSPCAGYARVFDARDTDADLSHALRLLLARTCAESGRGGGGGNALPAMPSAAAPDACALLEDATALRQRAAGRERTLMLFKSLLHERCQAEAVAASVGAGGGYASGFAATLGRDASEGGRLSSASAAGGANARGGEAARSHLMDAMAAMAQAEEQAASARSESSTYFTAGAHGIPGLPLRALTSAAPPPVGGAPSMADAEPAVPQAVAPIELSFGEGVLPDKVQRLERAALRELYRAAGGASWAASQRWEAAELDHGEYCAWAGVSCQQGARSGEVMPLGVIALELPDAGLDGSLPPGLSKLRHLAVLDLSGNRLRGEIPATLGELPRLRRLRLGRNAFGGGVPQGALAAPELREVDVSGNRLVAVAAGLRRADSEAASAGDDGETIPLALLNISFNAVDERLDELVPADCARRWAAVEALSLANNRLFGAIGPACLASLPQLALLDLAHNALEGPLPAALMGAPAMRVLDVSHNRLEGPLPPEVPGGGYSSALRVFAAADNRLTGALPAALCAAPALRHLDVSANALGGALPGDALAGAENLRLLNLSLNALTGPMPGAEPANDGVGGAEETPEELAARLGLPPGVAAHTRRGSLARLRALRVLDLSNNRLSGTLAPSLAELGALRILSIATNALTGSVPGGIKRLTALTELDLSGNALSGDFPEEAVAALTRLTALDLSRNELGGTLNYAALERLTDLRRFSAQGNPSLGYA